MTNYHVYQPKHLDHKANVVTGQLKDLSGYYTNVDALHHWWDESYQAKSDTDAYRGFNTEEYETVDLLTEALRSHLEPKERKVDRIKMSEEPDWINVRESTVFLAGGIVKYNPKLLAYLKAWLKEETVFIDASDYTLLKSEDTPLSHFQQLMHLADQTKQIVEDGLCKDYPNDPRKILNIINSQPNEVVTFSEVESDVEPETKWFLESKYLAEELIKITPFQKNFNTLVITGAHRYIVSDQLNLNKLYRLFAKLGRINTRIVFVG